ncbi:MAG TPA: flagellar biosynthesis anti-sigma factor FlgM [Chloroflexota bacterium]|nr:flagellar biosynthesis anti-sigma factor FlgM [Chloroflexota bacterium]
MADMKIDEAALRQIVQSYGPKGQGTSGNAGRSKATGANGSQGDAITISNEGQELQRMIRAAQAADGIRSQRVLDLQTQLRTGGYALDPQLIANSMLGISGGGN